MEKSDAQDTISWQEVRSFVSGFSKLLLQKAKQFWYLVLIVVLLPVIVFTIKSYVKEKEYQLQSTIGFHYSHQKIYGQLTVDLNYLLINGRYDELNVKLANPQVNWENIRSIETKNLFGYRLEEDLGALDYPFYLVITGKKPEDLMPCAEAVIHYFDTHSSIIQRQSLELKLLSEQKSFYTKQIHVIDSLIQHPGTSAISFKSEGKDTPVMISDEVQLLELQEKYMQRIAEIELDILNKETNIKVLSYGVVKEI